MNTLDRCGREVVVTLPAAPIAIPYQDDRNDMISVDFKVVGLTFVDKYPRNIEVIYRMMVARRMASQGVTGGAPPYEPIRVELVRNPANEHDPNAVEVHVQYVGMIGHAPRGVAMDLAPCLDSEPNLWSGYVSNVLVHQNDPHLKQPGIQVHVYEVALRPDGSQIQPLRARASVPTVEEFQKAVREMKNHQTALKVADFNKTDAEARANALKGGTG